MTSIHHFFQLISETFASEPYLWTPNWWYLLTEETLKNLIQKESTALDISNFETWRNSILRVLRMWSAYFDPWAITSLTQLEEKTGNTLGHIYKWSLSPQTYENIMLSWITCLNVDPPAVESCLDTSLRKTISMLSIPAHSVPGNVDVNGSATSQLVNGSLKSQTGTALGYTGGEQTSKTLDCPTGYTSSSISFFASGCQEEQSKLGLTVPIGDLFVVVSNSIFS